jgi:hypothetical protein
MFGFRFEAVDIRLDYTDSALSLSTNKKPTMSIDAKHDLKADAARLEDAHLAKELLFGHEKKPVRQVLRENPYILGLAIFASLGGFLFG